MYLRRDRIDPIVLLVAFVKIYSSVERIPEFSVLTPPQRRALLLFAHGDYQSKDRAQFEEFCLIGLLILAEIAGFIGGFVYWGTPFWGPLAGGIIAMLAIIIVCYGFSVFVTIPRMRRYFNSPPGRARIEFVKDYVNPETGLLKPSSDIPLDRVPL